MKTKLNRIVAAAKSEAGLAPMVLVMVMVLVSGMVVSPLLSYMSTGLESGEVHEQGMTRFYAADAGIEDALLRIKDDNLPDWMLDVYDLDHAYDPFNSESNPPYPLLSVNDKDVDIEIRRIWILEDLESDQNGTLPHAEFMVMGRLVESGKFRIDIVYDGSSGQLKIDRIGAWLPRGFSYVTGSSDGASQADPDEGTHNGGTKLIWEFHPAVNFEDLPALGEDEGGFSPGIEYPPKRSLVFEFTPAEPDNEPNGTFGWVRTNRMDIYLSWDVDSDTYEITSVASDESGKSTTVVARAMKGRLHKTLAIHGDSMAVGNSLMEDTDGDDYGVRDVLHESTFATVSGIPIGAEVDHAYLYWSGWRNSGYPDNPDEDDLQQLVAETAKVNKVTFNGTETTATRWAVQKNNNQSWSYSCFADVTDEITGDGNGIYTVGHFYDMTNYPLGDIGGEWSYAGWSLVMIYSHPDEEAHQIYLYDNFLYADNDSYFPFTITGFEAPEDWMEIEGRLTCFVGEGDWCYGDHRYDHWSEAPWGDTDWIKFNGEYLDDPSDTETPSNDNVWNGMSGVGTFIDGVDFDEWDVSDLIEPGDTWADIELGTGVDSWNLIYILLSIRADIGEGQLAYDVGTMSYQIGEE